MTRELHVQKRELYASLYLTNAEVLRGTVYLAEYSATHTGPQTIADVMSDPAPMLPMRDRSDRFVMVGRAGIVAAEVARTDVELHGLHLRVPARIETTAGHRFEGVFLIDEGAGERISDVLNSNITWLLVETPATYLWLARDHILIARPDDRPS